MAKIKITNDTYISGQPIAAGSVIDTDETTASLLKGYCKAVDATSEEFAAAEKANKTKTVNGKEAK